MGELARRMVLMQCRCEGRGPELCPESTGRHVGTAEHAEHARHDSAFCHSCRSGASHRATAGTLDQRWATAQANAAQRSELGPSRGLRWFRQVRRCSAPRAPEPQSRGTKCSDSLHAASDRCPLRWPPRGDLGGHLTYSTLWRAPPHRCHSYPTYACLLAAAGPRNEQRGL